jgi:hypothetical protein
MNNYPLLQTLIKANTKSNDAEVQTLFKDTLKITSVFDITRLTEADFKAKVETAIKKDEKLKETPSIIDVKKLYDNAKCFSAQVAQLYREQQLSSGEAQHHWHPPGIRAVEKQGPSYTNLFKENWDDSCKVDSISAIDSPVAYLRALYLFAGQLETSGSPATDKDKRLLLEKRRPDLADLWIDQSSTFDPQPMLKIINELLDKSIQKALETTPEKGLSTYSVLAKRRYPFALPYNVSHHQCLLGLHGHKPSLGALNYLISTRLPISEYFDNQYGQVLSSSPAEAQELLSGLSPQQQTLLTEPAPGEQVPTGTTLNTEQQQRKDDYWKNLYGTSEPASLSNMTSFMKRTELNADQIEALLSQGKYAPRHSSNDPHHGSFLSPYGARYINGPSTMPCLAILNDAGGQTITQTTDQRLVRLQRMIRLQRWSGISFADLDVLIISAFESQNSRNALMQIDTHTVRTLGVYRFLNRQYSITAEEFAALLYQVSTDTNSDTPALFDRVFNPARLFDTPLALNDLTFSIDVATPASHTILQHLSASLGLPITDDSLLLVVKNTQRHLGPLKCDLRTLSSIYRQARIARMFGVSVADCAALAQLISGESASECLAIGHARDNQTIRIKISAPGESFELIARFRVPSQADPQGATRLLSGSTLTTTTSKFANSEMVGSLFIQFPKSPIDEDDTPNIAIKQLPTVAANTSISLEGYLIELPGGILDAFIQNEKLSGIVALSPRKENSNDLPDTSNYTNVTLTNAHQEINELNISDVILQMDWITTWLSESVYNVPTLRYLLAPISGDDHSFRGLQQYLEKLTHDADKCAISKEEIAKLSLPKLPESIKWRTLMAKELLDAQGLVKNIAPAIENDVPLQLDAALTRMLSTLNLAKAIEDSCRKKLKDLLLIAHERQLHLVEKLLQEVCMLPMNCAKAVLYWANTSTHTILTDALNKTLTLLAQTLAPVMRHAAAAVQLHLSNSALREFLSHPHWLDPANTRLAMTLGNLYWLDRFNHCMTTYHHPEENLLSYLRLANSNGANSATLNGFLAKLLNGSEAEISTLTARLPDHYARTMKDLDWVMRSLTACTATGLSAASLLGATALNNNSPESAWKAVGEAVMAASH